MTAGWAGACCCACCCFAGEPCCCWPAWTLDRSCPGASGSVPGLPDGCSSNCTVGVSRLCSMWSRSRRLQSRGIALCSTRRGALLLLP
jgi:hypothetical protein